jgi:glucose-6-phosphate isomerase
MSWNTYTENLYVHTGLDFTLDYSLMGADAAFFEEMEPKMQAALQSMRDLEAGSIANPDENRMVGHYWLRSPEKAPQPELTAAIEENISAIEAFAKKVHLGEIKGNGGAFEHLLVIGIGGSALGPQFVAQALGQPGEDRLQLHFFDNTDPDGMDLVLANLRGQLDKTLAVVISKSGGTPETRNGMLEAVQAYMSEGIEFASQAVAITGDGSNLDKVASDEGWLERFPMWDWVGGRTSELAGVGLFPAALQGLDIRGILKGAAEMDALTLNTVTRENPAALLSLLWFHATNGKGEKDMVILPYKDRLMLFSKYLQQLIMESLGKEKDLDGNTVYQGIAVYGNKGSTDQHAYVQQLREGVNNFFATFIEVKKDREGASIDVEDGITSGDYLHAFLLGTRSALAEMDRASLTISIDEVNPRTVGMLIALYERAVGYYAFLVNINAYHQPGVEAGKKAAATFLQIQQDLKAFLANNKGQFFTAPAVAQAINAPEQAVTVFKLLEHAVANPSKGIQKKLNKKPFDSEFGMT